MLPEVNGDGARSGGAIHSFTLNEGGLRDELADAMSWLAEADVPAAQRSLHDSLLERVAHVPSTGRERAGAPARTLSRSCCSAP